MLNIFLKNTIIHNLEYEYDENIKNLEDARIFCFFYNYDVILHFKKENKFWFSKISPHLKFKFCENDNLCDVYIIYRIKNLINFNNEILTNRNIDNKILFIIYGSLNNYNNNNDFLNNYYLKETLLLIIEDNHLYKLNSIEKDYYFIIKEEIDLKKIYIYYKILTNIKNKRYKYIMCYNTDIIIPCNSKEFIESSIDKVKSNLENEIIISNNIQKFIFCKTSVFEEFQFTNKYIKIKPHSLILNDT
jgi:hypothetical protein